MQLNEQKTAKLDKAIQTLLSEPRSEFELLTALQKAPYELFPKSAFDDTQLLFQVHFTLYNALYRLQNKGLANKQFYLDILPTRIVLEPYKEASIDSQQISIDNKLKQYYLDWRNFSETTEDELNDMLNNFWQLLEGKQNQMMLTPYLSALSFEKMPEMEQLKSRYRTLSLLHHPDKGGDKTTFATINNAFRVLKKNLSSR